MSQPKVYDVFLSFRGDDGSAKFVSHLHSSLQNAGISVFRGDEIQQGDDISISLLRAIRHSRISIVVLSINYANSRWCMFELEKIMEIGRTGGLVVVPVLYEVDPSEVRHQEGQFGKALEDLILEISVDESTKSNWRRDLIDIGGKDGFIVTDSRNESADIKNIVEHVTRLLDKTDLFVVEYPVGVRSRVEDVTNLLNIQNSNDVLLLGIWGMGGLGKTTLAKAIYNQIGIKFEGRSFLLNIREVWETDTNQVSLQQQILCDVYKTTELKILDIESGKNLLKERLAQKRVLLVLDDVNKLDQLKALCGSRKWFGPGSRVIITTRDMRLLRSCRVDLVYTVVEMDERESLELFCWHAFKQPCPPEGFATHSRDVIVYSGGLPLALQVLGSYLSGCETTEWQKVLEKLKCIPHDQVQKKLKVSFDGLKDVTEKQIFFDIACFFIGMDKNDIIQILNGCGYFGDIGIEVLVQQSLVTVDIGNKLRMHDLLRDMGRQIVYEESPFHPEMRSRLWFREEVFDMLSNHKGTEAVKGLALEFPREVCLETKSFKKMNKLRLLRLAGVKLKGDFKYLSGDLKWLYWHGFPETYVPAEFQLGSLVVMELKYSKLKQIWNKSQMLENLKVLNLSHSLDLTETPDFSYMPNLEKLILEDCPSLSTVSHSIGSLHKILLINLTDCTGLRTLPKSIYKLKSLATLILSGCSMLDKLEDLEQMESLTTLIADKTAIPEVPSSLPKMYDVFLSFRGEDNRPRFISHLHSSLHSAGIYAFKDDDGIQRGDQISVSLGKAIEQSRISIVVLSTNYANSRWCMLELEKIMEVGRMNGRVVVPVFYDVDPSEVRHQKGRFGKAFEELLSTISVDESTYSNWRRQLFDIGGIAGFVLVGSRNESAAVKNIVEYVTRLLDRTELFVAEHPVGVEHRVQAATKLLNIQKSEDVLLLGIWGMGGTGKTTLAKAIYNQIGSKFEGRSFVLNIREFWETNTNLVSLQQKVLCDVYKTLTFKIRDIESGKNILKERLSQTSVLLVLDDVNKLDQLKALYGSREWFGPGSRIIITTRDKHLLSSCPVDVVYTIEEMDESESLKLFSWHAFKQSSPKEDFAKHSTDVIAYSGGLPLALEVIGSYLSDCKITTEWDSVLEKLKCIPHDEVQEKLKVSFHGLKHFTEKQIFLDIACFFIGMDKKDAIQILNGCGFFADDGIKVLVERALVTVDNENKLRMHDLLRDMGRQIIFEESPEDPEKRSRLWRHEEVFDILEKRKGTEGVKGLALEFPTRDCLETKAFKKMNKLRLLRLAGVKLKGDFKYLSGDLKWLYWHGFPETYIPAEFQLQSLVVMELKYSKLKQIWNNSQMLKNLKILNLSHSLDLTETPDFSYLPNLEKLVLKNCPSLSTVSQSIGSLQKILLINLRDCAGLRKLPRNIYKLKSLETLILSGCSMIDKLEEDVEQMESLTTLIADKTAITKVPFSIVRLKSIGYISFRGFEGFSRDVFPSLVWSWMSPSNNVISLVQTSVSMSSLGTSKDLQKLRILCVECRTDLQLTEEIARFLEVLKATNCENLEGSASSTTSEISDMYASPFIDDCPGQVCISGSKNHLLIRMGTKCHVSNIAEDSFLQTTDGTSDPSLLPCDDKFNRLIFSCNGCSIIFDVPTMKGSNLKSIMLFVVYYSSPENITSEGCKGMLIINYTKRTVLVYKRDTLTSFEDEDWQSITSNLEPGNKVEVMVVFAKGFFVKKTTLSLLYDEPVDKEMQRCFVVDEEDVIVSGNDDNNVSVSGGDNEAVHRFGKGFTVNRMLITKRADGLYADVMGLVQLILHDPDLPAEVVAEEIHAAEAECDTEQQVPPTDGQLEQQAEVVAPVGIGPALTQILDALRELKVDFVRLEQTVTSRLNAVEVRLEVLEDVITQIPRGSSSD
ncbi:putative TIR domain, winged helix-turn-helix DNA-binding domain-containing protein [Medicago truncatula]|uniref:Disease resistance protein (TIR-NBS-LRR class) n=1 Tax=Medicago truncatula TaxID=3880 RepID=G7JSD3_MEDTR|nr:uncharacterized protein LOC11422497 [Medicago truncatula]AES87072.2 disease resistance protein (TIR-NBS-LRR class) [Medicago truncatula]RHN59059.1 putative TIR domain, winged helix-turn-helix DNA-binding domain-containing protein [Medicago truncatula]